MPKAVRRYMPTRSPKSTQVKPPPKRATATASPTKGPRMATRVANPSTQRHGHHGVFARHVPGGGCRAWHGGTPSETLRRGGGKVFLSLMGRCGSPREQIRCRSCRKDLAARYINCSHGAHGRVGPRVIGAEGVGNLPWR